MILPPHLKPQVMLNFLLTSSRKLEFYKSPYIKLLPYFIIILTSFFLKSTAHFYKLIFSSTSSKTKPNQTGYNFSR